MKVCVRSRSKMTQRNGISISRSSILFMLAVFMTVFVGASADNINENNHPSDNNTQYNVDIQANFIDSEIKQNELNGTLPEEPVVIDLGHELPNITSTEEKLNESAINDYETTTMRNDLSIEENQGSEESTSQEPIATTKSNQTETQEFQIEMTTEEIPITTFAPFIENTKKVENTVLVETTTQPVEKQTEDIDIQQELATTTKEEKLKDLNRFFEDEPSQARLMRGFHKDADNEIESESESESESVSESSSESKSGHSSENKTMSTEDENRAAENTSDASSEETSSRPKVQVLVESTTQAPMTVEEVEEVTESIEEIPIEVTIVENVKTHTVMKKAGVDDELLINSNDQPMQEILDNRTINIDPVVDLVVNRSKEVINSSSSLEIEKTTTSIDEVGSTVNMTITNSKLEETTESLTELKGNESVATPFEIQGKQLPEDESPLVSHPENNSSTDLNIKHNELNAASETKNSEDFGTNHLIDEIETATQAPEVNISELSLEKEKALEITPINDENGIFKKFSQGEVYEISTAKPVDKIEQNISTKNDPLQTPADENSANGLNDEVNSISNPEIETVETSTEAPSANDNDQSKLSEEVQEDQTVKTYHESSQNMQENHINAFDESLPDPKLYADENETPTLKPSSSSEGKGEFMTTTDYARHVDSLQTMRDETSSMVTNEVIAPASVGRSFNEIIAEGLGKALPTRSVGDQPSSSSYSSEDKTTTVIVLCAAAGGIFLAFSFAIYLISFQRQNGVLDIEMQEQRCGKDNLDEDDDSETRVSLLNQMPTADSDEHSSY